MRRKFPSAMFQRHSGSESAEQLLRITSELAKDPEVELEPPSMSMAFADGLYAELYNNEAAFVTAIGEDALKVLKNERLKKILKDKAAFLSAYKRTVHQHPEWIAGRFSISSSRSRRQLQCPHVSNRPWTRRSPHNSSCCYCR